MHLSRNLGIVTAPMLAGVDRLWREVGEPGLLINGQWVEPACWFDETGLDDSAKTWTCRKTGTVLSGVGAGTSPDLSAHGPHLGEHVAEFAAAEALAASGNVFCDITTEDMVILTALKWSNTNSVRPFGKFSSPNGYVLLENSDRANFVFYDGAGSVSILTATLTESWKLLACFVDRSGSAQWYDTGAASGSPTVVSGVSGSCSVAQPITIGGTSAGGSVYGAWDGTAALVAIFKASGWLDSHLQPDVARELASLWLGHQALHNHAAVTPSTL